MCIFEGSNLSEGRGTAKPFEFMGAPFIDATAFAKRLNGLGLRGVRFRPVYFTPTFSKHKGVMCGGVQVHVTDFGTFDPIVTALHVLKEAYAMYPDKVEIKPYASKLMGVPKLHERIKTESVDAITATWKDNLAKFGKMRKKHLLY
jgi:uncharacterized protein YbbC (DUF1343 family)